MRATESVTATLACDAGARTRMEAALGASECGRNVRGLAATDARFKVALAVTVRAQRSSLAWRLATRALIEKPIKAKHPLWHGPTNVAAPVVPEAITALNVGRAPDAAELATRAMENRTPHGPALFNV